MTPIDRIQPAKTCPPADIRPAASTFRTPACLQMQFHLWLYLITLYALLAGVHGLIPVPPHAKVPVYAHGDVPPTQPASPPPGVSLAPTPPRREAGMPPDVAPVPPTVEVEPIAPHEPVETRVHSAKFARRRRAHP
ncbi:hypothetical protein EV122DRAFT_276054 [Schizophyllum commune]